MDKLDFYKIRSRCPKKGEVEVYPDFQVIKSNDIMVRGKSFYAIWDEANQMWSTDEYLVRQIVDRDLEAYAEKNVKGKTEDGDEVVVKIKRMVGYSSSSWKTWKNYLKDIPDNAHVLDDRLTFANTTVTKKDYVSKKLPYALEPGPCPSWDEMVGTLYSPEEREKIEWAIGAIVSGDSKSIQKFIVLYGDPGAGKGTILDIIMKLFEGYYATFEARALTSVGNTFATETFRTNPLVAIENDSDLSRIESNTTLNSIVSHEEITIHEKYKPAYTMRMNSFLFLATNKPVKITDAKSGIIRRLIDVTPTGTTIPPKRYSVLKNQINFELGQIASHCLEVYQQMGKNYYNTYRPMQMIYKTDVFFNFVEDNFLTFANQDGTSLKAAYETYKQYCEDSGTEGYKLPRYKFREELKNYFRAFDDIKRVDDKQIRSYYSGFLTDKFKPQAKPPEEHPYSLILDQTESEFDKAFADCPAQYASRAETPQKPWADVKTKLSSIDTKKLHYVKPPENLIVIDFDLKDADGKKDPEKNLAAASEWPATYAEFSKGGGGIHLHYYYSGDVSKLSSVYSDGIEVKTFLGGSSLRRKLSRCNGLAIATLSGGLKEKEEKPVINFDAVKSEKSLRNLIDRNLRKEIHPGTKPSIDFIRKILDDAYASGMKYDISDMYQKVIVFATNSTNHSLYCLDQVRKMHFRSEDPAENVSDYDSEELVYFDVEVFPNLLLVVWKYAGADRPLFRMWNPTPVELEAFFKHKLVGYNCRRYDNHVLYARYLGKSLEEVYNISRGIIEKKQGCMFGEAYNLSYADVFDYLSVKQTLKKWELELHIPHAELDIPWDKPVDESLWETIAKYCENDVLATEAVANARLADWTARLILSAMTGSVPNDSTNTLTAKFIFQGDKNPQRYFNYRDLGGPEGIETISLPWYKKDGTPDEFTQFLPNGKPIFPGYSFKLGHSEYRGEDPKEGGYVYAEPGFYGNVALLDIASMHPSSIVAEELFGPLYTQRFKEIMDARIAIKHKDFEKARTMMGGILEPFLKDENSARDLANALKIAINSVYGLTSASFKNPFKDDRNKDNIVAKRGALFMINLKHMVQDAGFTVAHIKTDSIKIPDATPEIIQKVMDYGKLYGYNFEHEATYEKMCLVNDAVYIAYEKGEDGKKGHWTATGAQFQHPYVFKKLFTKEKIDFYDLCEIKTVQTAMYLDFNEDLPEGEHKYFFIGRAGSFCPVVSGSGGGILLRKQDDKFHAATGTKGYRWKESEVVKGTQTEDTIDFGYFNALVDAAKEAIGKYIDVEWFASEDPYVQPFPGDDDPPWNEIENVPCGGKYKTCFECPNFHPMDSVNPEDYLATTCDGGYSLSKIYYMYNKEDSNK